MNHKPSQRKLSPDDVRKIRWLLYYHMPMAAIARRYKVSNCLIAGIRDDQFYRDVT